MIAAALMVAILFGISSCSRAEYSSFDREREAVERALPSEARLLSSSDTNRTTNSVEASWQYEIPGNVEQAKSQLRRAFNGKYQLLQEDSTQLAFGKFDGADSFSLTIRLQPGLKMTTLSISLKSIPG